MKPCLLQGDLTWKCLLSRGFPARVWQQMYPAQVAMAHWMSDSVQITLCPLSIQVPVWPGKVAGISQRSGLWAAGKGETGFPTPSWGTGSPHMAVSAVSILKKLTTTRTAHIKQQSQAQRDWRGKDNVLFLSTLTDFPCILNKRPYNFIMHWISQWWKQLFLVDIFVRLEDYTGWL
jgi:hypothetical protein